MILRLAQLILFATTYHGGELVFRYGLSVKSLSQSEKTSMTTATL